MLPRRTVFLATTVAAGALVLPSTSMASASVTAEAPSVSASAAAAVVLPTVTGPTKKTQIVRALKKSRLNKGKRPKRFERPEPYVKQTACNNIPKPGLVAFQTMLREVFPRPDESFRSYNIPGNCTYPGAGEHLEGRAIDYEFDYDKKYQRRQANQLLKYLTKRKGYHAKRLGVMYIIWNQKVWGTYNQRWRGMSNRGSKTHNHRDHIHVSFTWNGALKRTSYYTGKTRATHYGSCPKYRGQFASYKKKIRYGRCGGGRSIPKKWYAKTTSTISPWTSGDRVSRLQTYLADQGFYKATIHSYYTADTYRAVRRWQKGRGIPRTGVWDRESQRRSHQPFWTRSYTAITGWNTEAAIKNEGDLVADRVRVKTGSGYVSRTIQLQRRAKGTSDWVVVGTGTTASDGRYRAKFTAPLGVWYFRFVVVDSSTRMPAVSSSRRVKILAVEIPEPTPTPAETEEPEVGVAVLGVEPQDLSVLQGPNPTQREPGYNTVAEDEPPPDLP